MIQSNPADQLVPFPLGQIVVDRSSTRQLSPEDIIPALTRHIFGDWGRVGQRRREANEKALREKQSLCSMYFSSDGVRFRVITNAARSLTTVKAS